MKLQGKSVVVTSVSAGMAKSIVELFVKEGANVVPVVRRQESLDKLGESLQEQPGKVLAFQEDVSKNEDNIAMIDYAVKEFGRLDVLVNNAGVMDDMASIAKNSDEKYEYVFGINVYGPLSNMRKACQVFLEQGEGGNMINVSSVGGSPQAAGPIYCASNATLNSISSNFVESKSENYY